MKKFSENEKQYFINVCNESASMSQACSKLNMNFNVFKKYAKLFGCYNPNQGGKGINKISSNKVSTQEILNGNHPEYHTYKLKIRLILEGYKKDECELCGWSRKLPDEKFSTCELHHIDGNSFNHSLDNLILLCPNCHSLTPTHRGRNKRNLSTK